MVIISEFIVLLLLIDLYNKMASNSFLFPTAPSNFGESVSAQASGLDPNSNRSTSQSHTVELGHSLDLQIPQAQDTTHIWPTYEGLVWLIGT